ncbi:MAG: FAD-dependent oxidoreductase, partial [Gemmatimonadetes bacterium]|nr:FAD-dependent oxidoreductase [Gemmatimonadota bacterium]NIW63245.1 FAD-dependent oxidoreductase [Gemmatimonadota bacterium]
MGLNRRDFLKVTGLQAGALAAGAGRLSAIVPDEERRGRPPFLPRRRPEVAVVGAGAFGLWTAWNLRSMGVDVVLVDQYGPGNSRATSGGETRGVRTGYGERELWTQWAGEAIGRWNRFDEEWRERHGLELFFRTGDLILREDWEPFLTNTRDTWAKLGVRHEVLGPDEIRYRWPHIDVDGIGAALYEYDAGVVRARRVCETLAEEFEAMGGMIRIGRATPGRSFGGRLVDVMLEPGDRLEADTFVFALGPWFGKLFPEVMGDRMRAPLGYVFYYGIPAGDNRFRYPNMPSYNVPGVTGWPALTPDSRGFRVRTGGGPPPGPRRLGPLHRARVPRAAPGRPEAVLSGDRGRPGRGDPGLPLRDHAEPGLAGGHAPGPGKRLALRRGQRRGLQVRTGAGRVHGPTSPGRGSPSRADPPLPAQRRDVHGGGTAGKAAKVTRVPHLAARRAEPHPRVAPPHRGWSTDSRASGGSG